MKLFSVMRKLKTISTNARKDMLKRFVQMEGNARSEHAYLEKQSKCRFDLCAYAHEKDVKTVRIEFLESNIVELKADIIILEKNLCNENKILSHG